MENLNVCQTEAPGRPNRVGRMPIDRFCFYSLYLKVSQKQGNTMQPDQVASRILEILAEVAEGLDLSNLDPDLSLREQLGLDSVAFLDFVMVLRNRYGIEVPEEDYQELLTLNTSVEYLGPRFDRSGSS